MRINPKCEHRADRGIAELAAVRRKALGVCLPDQIWHDLYGRNLSKGRQCPDLCTANHTMFCTASRRKYGVRAGGTCTYTNGNFYGTTGFGGHRIRDHLQSRHGPRPIHRPSPLQRQSRPAGANPRARPDRFNRSHHQRRRSKQLQSCLQHLHDRRHPHRRNHRPRRRHHGHRNADQQPQPPYRALRFAQALQLLNS